MGSPSSEDFYHITTSIDDSDSSEDDCDKNRNFKFRTDKPPTNQATNHKNFLVNSMMLDDDEPPSKKPSFNYSSDSVPSFQVGYEEKEARGVELDVKFDPTLEDIQVKETVKWLHSSDDPGVLSKEVLEFWQKTGPRKTTIDDEITFCDPVILQQILNSKTKLDPIKREDIIAARARSNPFEIIRGSIFQNRSAVKMANLDSICGFMFTDPKNENGESLIKDLLYFANVCGGPGGFAEYILWRKKWHAKGIGFSLRNDDDFKLNAFWAGNTETFDTYYGIHNDGNILDPENIESLEKYVLKETRGAGVHILMADGGLSVEDKNIQEIVCKHLYLCQCLAALSLVQEGGSFVVKLFDIFTLFSAGLVYLMYKCFKQISIIKPNSTRPSNSERFLVGKFKKGNIDTIRRYLFDINQEMWYNLNSDTDVFELVPYDVIKGDQKFFNYLCESNNSIGRKQIVNLLKIVAFCNDKSLVEPRQAAMRQKCLDAWLLPTDRRRGILTVHATFKHLMDDWFDQKDFMLTLDNRLNDKSDLSYIFRDRSNWYFVPVDTVEKSEKIIRTFFMSRGGHHVCYLRNGTWQPLQHFALEISVNTLIYGEIVNEFGDVAPVYTLHIIDGMVLGGVNIRNLPLKERLKMCEKFANALNKPIRMINVGGQQMLTSPISCKKLYPLATFRQFFDQLSYYTLGDGRKRLGFKIQNCNGPDRFYLPRGLLFFYDQIENPESLYSSMKTTFVNKLLWEWKDECEMSGKLNGILCRSDLDNYIYNDQPIDLTIHKIFQS